MLGALSGYGRPRAGRCPAASAERTQDTAERPEQHRGPRVGQGAEYGRETAGACPLSWRPSSRRPPESRIRSVPTARCNDAHPHAEMRALSWRISMHRFEYSRTFSRPCGRLPWSLFHQAGGKSDRRIFQVPPGVPTRDTCMHMLQFCAIFSLKTVLRSRRCGRLIIVFQRMIIQPDRSFVQTRPRYR